MGGKAGTAAKKGTGTAGMVKLGPWPKGDGGSGYGKAGTVAKRGRGQRVW